MGKYANLEKDIFSIFDSVSWKAENIKTYPSNFIKSEGVNEFIRITIIAKDPGLNIKSISGVLLIDIFTSAGAGPNRVTVIADKLDLYLSGVSKTLTSGVRTQFLSSTLYPNGIDKDNTALYRSTYTIPFNYFGVL